MSRTTREFKGQEHPEKTRRSIHKDKFFGYTSGTHSHKEGDYAPKKLFKTGWTKDGENGDFMKYGYPDGIYPKHLVIAKKKGYPSTKYKNLTEA